ncbi:hypothetical protein HYALB_00001897 [Hymenoscyphus albidus]|uniref:FAD-binding PCMH-type domain-containing protein n=1 Tax=Hymenoscyphus albidus TaxID=595503 RepID=A0A9N9PQX6_9HELO|nr:hypothetical protein HYALB_00001897 [Hymenoscyphus albidus]
MRISQLFDSSPSEKKPGHPVAKPTSLVPELAVIVKKLLSELPSRIVLPDDTDAFRQLMIVYWAKQECEVIPACIIQPQNTEQLSTIVSILKRAFDDLKQGTNGTEEKHTGIFAVRGGGHSPVPGAASIEGGIIIDLRLFREVTPSDDGKSVGDVSKVLDQKGLAVVGGRNSAVGVGGLTLGGEQLLCSDRDEGFPFLLPVSAWYVPMSSATKSYWPLVPSLKHLNRLIPIYGVLLKGVATISESSQALQSSVFLAQIYGAVFLPALFPGIQGSRRLPPNSSHSESENTAGPIVCFSYIHSLGIQAISVNLVNTSPPLNLRKWPTYWKNSPFSSLWRLWSTCKTQSLSSATDELNALNPPGRRQIFITTTIKNDATTLTGAHAAYSNAIPALCDRNVRKGYSNPLGLDETEESLVLVSFTINWDEREDDEFMRDMARSTLNEIDAFAMANDTAHRYRYLNYCTDWQRPFDGYGEENKRFLEEVSKKYDVDGLFQKGCRDNKKNLI